MLQYNLKTLAFKCLALKAIVVVVAVVVVVVIVVVVVLVVAVVVVVVVVVKIPSILFFIYFISKGFLANILFSIELPFTSITIIMIAGTAMRSLGLL
ncbi:hypothetical protein ElyMa_004825500 [Elysia marginata]|uniref:Uncharacterized protein n=1 Tax=Elysia marginata TaxID=1093978 RepID=A0AAV4IQP2_9GAST|nr:hypothetical protein ElyMa_004825500 [Elysia marginata]